MPGKIVSSNVKPLGELNPDFVLSVKYLVDQAGVPIENSDQKFAKLIKTLRDVGFYSQVRPGEDSTLLVFIKINDGVLLKALKSFHLKDYLYGVKNSIDDDEQILEHLSSAEKLRAAYSLISDPEWEGGAGITPGAGQWAHVEKIIPLYDYELTKRLVTEWSKKPLIDENDIATIKDIAGEKVALYFGFLRFYTVWLVVPSVLGFISYVFFSRYSIVFTVLNLLWAIVMTNSWKKKENVYAITWNTKGSSLIETKRGEFVGESEEIDTVTGIKSPTFPSWKRTLRELAFLPVALGAALVLVSYQFGCFFIEIFLNEIYEGPGKQFLSLVPTVLIVGFIPVLTAGYTVFVNKFMAWENHDTNTSYERSFVQKQFILNFLASYMPLIITSFVYLPFGHLVNPYLSTIQTHTSKYNISVQQHKFQINKDRLNQQFAYFAVTAQVVGFLVENIVPVVLRKVSEYFRGKKENNSAVVLTDLPEEAQFLQEVRKQVSLPPFNVNDEYREMVVQFGYLAIFSPVWSLAPIVSLVNNWIEFRGDAYKLFNEAQRPIPVKVDSIAPWNTNLRVLTWLATLIAPAITALFRHSDILEASAGSHLHSPVKIPAWSLLAIVLFTEHISIGLNFLVESVYSKIGTKTERDFKSNIYQTRRQYIDGYIQQTNSTGEFEKRSIPIDPTEQYWEDFSDEQVVKHASIIPKQVIDAIALKKQKEEAEKEEARVLAEKKKAEAAKEKALQEEASKANAQASNTSYQAYSENGDSNLQSRSTTASKSVPGATAISGAGFAAGAVVGAVGALTGGAKDPQDGTQPNEYSQGVPASTSDPATHSRSTTAPQTSQGYPAQYNTSGTSKVSPDVAAAQQQQQRSVPDAATQQFANGAHHPASSTQQGSATSTRDSSGPGAVTGAAVGAGVVGSGVAGSGVAGTTGASSTGPNEYASSESSAPSKSSGEKKGGFFSKLTKKDASSVGKAAKTDATKFSGQAQGIASDVKKGDYSSAKKFAADAKENPDKYVGNSKDALKQAKSGNNSGAATGSKTGANSDYGSSSSTGANPSSQAGHSGSAGYGAAAAGAGVAGAGIAGHESSKSGHGDATTAASSSNPKTSGTSAPSSGYKDQSASSTRGNAPSSSSYNDNSSSTRSGVAADSNIEAQSDSVNPYNAVPKDASKQKSQSSGHGKEAAAAGVGASAVGAGVAGSSGSGSHEASGVYPQKEEKKGLFSRFTKKDASSVAKGAKADASKFSGQAQTIASDVKKGDYSSAKKFAADAKENPDKYVGNTKAAYNDSKATSGSAASTQDTSKGASKVPAQSSSSGHGVSGKEAAVGGVAGAGAAGYAASGSHHQKSTGSNPQTSSSTSSGPQQSSSGSTGKSSSDPSGSTAAGAGTGGVAGATLPPNLSSGSDAHKSKSTSASGVSSAPKQSSVGHGSTTGYTGADSEAFANQPSQALKNSDAQGYTSSEQAQQGSRSGSQHGSQSNSGKTAAGAATGAAVGAGGAAAYGSGSHSQDKSSSHSKDISEHTGSSDAPSASKNDHGIPQNLANPFVEGVPQSDANKPTADSGPNGSSSSDQKTLDPKSANQVKTSSGIDARNPEGSTSKPSKTGATEDSHPASTGIDEDKQSSGGFGLGGIAAGLAGAAGATGLASKFGGSGGDKTNPASSESKEGTIPSGNQKISSNLSGAGEKSYLDNAKGYAENAGSTFNDYVQVAADKADEYAKNSDNQYINKGNHYVQELAEKSDEYANNHGGNGSSATKSATDPSGSAGAAATKSSSGGKDSTAGVATGAAASASKTSGSATGPNGSSSKSGAAIPGSTSGAAGSTSGSSQGDKKAYNQFANKEHQGSTSDDDQTQSESLPKHFQHENKNPYSGKVGPVPGTEDQVIAHTKTSDIPKAEQGYGATHAAHGHSASAQPSQGDTLQPPKATSAAADTDSASSTSSPRKKKGLLSKIKQKVKGDSAQSSPQTTPTKKAPASSTA